MTRTEKEEFVKKYVSLHFQFLSDEELDEIVEILEIYLESK